MKYIDAEKLKYEIERRKYEWQAFLENNNAANPEVEKQIIFEDENILDIINSFQQEQSEVLSGEDVMVMCNQILIDWVKEGNTQEEKEQREQAHIRFFELYDDYLVQEQPQVADASKMEQSEAGVENYIQSYLEAIGFGYGGWVDGLRDEDLKKIARHFYKLGLKARKV